MKVQLVGTITLPVVVGAYPQQIAKEVYFLIVDCLYSYNAIIRRSILKNWKSVMSTYHLSVKFLTDYGIWQVLGDQLAARECYLAVLAIDEHVRTMNIEERKVIAEPTKVLEDIPLEEGNPKKFTRVGTSIEEKTKQNLIHFLRKRIDVFACLKDSYPLPCIDQLVDLMAGHQLLNFMDAFWTRQIKRRHPSLLVVGGGFLCVATCLLEV